MRHDRTVDCLGETYSAAVWEVSDCCEKLSERGFPSEGCWGAVDSITDEFG